MLANFVNDTSNFKLPKWDFSAVAWLEGNEKRGEEKLSWIYHFYKGVAFEVIEKNIDNLLKSSHDTLTKLTRAHFKKQQLETEH